MRKTNKWTSLILAFVMVISFMMPVGGNKVFATGNMFITSATASGGTLEQGDKFTVNIDVGFNQPQDKGIGGKTSVSINGPVKYAGLNTGITEVVESSEENEEGKVIGLWITASNLEYTGAGETLDITVNCGEAGTQTMQIKLSVRETVEATDAVAIVEGTTINVKAGETQEVTLKIKNATSAKVKESSVVITSPIGEGNDGFEISPKTIKLPAMDPGDTRSIKFNVSVAKSVKQGLYDLNVKIGRKDHKVQLKVASDFRPPTLELSVSNKELSANTVQEIAISVKNLGDIAAKNVEVTIAQNEKFAIVGGSNIKYIQNIEPKETQIVTLQGKVIDKAVSTIPLSIEVKYIDETGKEGKTSQYVYVNTEQSALSKGAVIENIIAPSGVYTPGQEFAVKFTVSAPEEIKNMQIKVTGSDVIVPRSTSLFVVDSMKKGEKKQYIVKFSPTKDVVTNTHLIGIEISYPTNEALSPTTQFTTVNIDNPKKEEEEEDDDKGKGKPKVIIGEYKSEPVIVKAGEEFDLKIGFLNTNKTKSVHNLKANLTIKEEGENGTGSVFTPVGASNTFFISDMNPGETVVKNIRLYTIPNAKPKTYEISLEMEYEDAEGNAITATEKLGIPVEQVTSLEVAEVRLETAQVGMETYMTAPIYNTGKTDISNVKISIQGEGFTVQDGTKFIGNFTKGASETYEPVLIPTQPGTLLGTILIQYETVTGEVENLTHEFELEVMDMPTMPEEGMFPDEGMIPEIEEEKASKLPTVVGVIIGIALAAGVTAVVLKKRKAKRDEFEIDED